MISGLRPIRSDSQPATSGIGTEKTIKAPYITPDVPSSSRAPGHVDEREQVDDTEPRPPPPSADVR
jgi:hypothetical protein